MKFEVTSTLNFEGFLYRDSGVWLWDNFLGYLVR